MQQGSESKYLLYSKHIDDSTGVVEPLQTALDTEGRGLCAGDKRAWRGKRAWQRAYLDIVHRLCIYRRLEYNRW